MWVSLNDGCNESSGAMCSFGNKRLRNLKGESRTDNLETQTI